MAFVKVGVVCFMSLSPGGLVCLKFWRLVRWQLSVCTFGLTFRGRKLSLYLIRACCE